MFPLWLLYIARGYLFERLQETRRYSLMEHETVFLKRKNLIFSLAAESISFIFCFLLPFTAEGRGFGAVNLSILF